MKELAVLAFILQVIAYYPKSIFLLAPYHFFFETTWSEYGRVTAYWGVWSVCYELIGTLQGEIICPRGSEAGSIDKPAYIISAQLFSLVAVVLSLAAMLLLIIYIGDVLRKKRLGQIAAFAGAGCQLGHGIVLIISVPPMLAGAINDAPSTEEITVQWSFFTGYADAGIVLASGAAALLAAIVGDKFGIVKKKETKKPAAKDGGEDAAKEKGRGKKQGGVKGKGRTGRKGKYEDKESEKLTETSRVTPPPEVTEIVNM